MFMTKYLHMQLIRTTLRLREDLKQKAERKALEENTSLQAIFNRALEDHLKKETKKQAKKIVFITHDLGVPLDNLRREDFYPEPKI